MTKDDFRAYVAAFNANDYAGFGRFYADDVVFELGAAKRIEGRENILAFYREVADHIREHVDVREVLTGARNVAMYCRTTFECHRDWPEFVTRPVVAGETWEVETIAMYWLNDDNRFAHIRGARFKP